MSSICDNMMIRSSFPNCEDCEYLSVIATLHVLLTRGNDYQSGAFTSGCMHGMLSVPASTKHNMGRTLSMLPKQKEYGTLFGGKRSLRVLDQI